MNGWVFGPIGVPNVPSIAYPELRRKKLNAEIAIGRSAVTAIIGMFFQVGLTGTSWDDWVLDTGAEVADGGLAMMAVIGVFFEVGLTSSAWGDWALFTDSPLRAYENEAGV